MPERSIRLVNPAYRRWLTPDQTGLEIDLVGFADAEFAGLRGEATVRELDGELRTTAELQLSGEWFDNLLRLPAFHRTAEIRLAIRSKAGGPTLAEAAWRIVRQDRAALADVVHFDGRRVLFHENFGRWPLWWRPPAGVAPATAVEACRAANLDGPVLPAAAAREVAPALAKAGLRVVAQADFAAAEAQARELRGVAELTAFLLEIPAGTNAEAAAAALAAVRRTHPRVPCIAAFPAGMAPPADYGDAVLRTGAAELAAFADADRAKGLPRFAEIPPTNDAMLRAAAWHAAGAFLAVSSDALATPETRRFVRRWRALESMLVRGVDNASGAAPGLVARQINGEVVMVMAIPPDFNESKIEGLALRLGKQPIPMRCLDGKGSPPPARMENGQVLGLTNSAAALKAFADD